MGEQLKQSPGLWLNVKGQHMMYGLGRWEHVMGVWTCED